LQSLDPLVPLLPLVPLEPLVPLDPLEPLDEPDWKHASPAAESQCAFSRQVSCDSVSEEQS
jgi:hypothetical protein